VSGGCIIIVVLSLLGELTALPKIPLLDFAVRNKERGEWKEGKG